MSSLFGRPLCRNAGLFVMAGEFAMILCNRSDGSTKSLVAYDDEHEVAITYVDGDKVIRNRAAADRLKECA